MHELVQMITKTSWYIKECAYLFSTFSARSPMSIHKIPGVQFAVVSYMYQMDAQHIQLQYRRIPRLYTLQKMNASILPLSSG